MIPKSVTRDRLLDALRHIDRDGVPRGRESRGYDLVHDGRSYPPKYVVALAIEAVTGRAADLEAFGGGEETNTFLHGHGFTVVAKGEARATGSSSPPRPVAEPTTKSTTVRVARVFLNLGVTMTDFRAKANAGEFGRLVQAQFDADPKAYRDRIVQLIRRGHEAGAEVVLLPACAMIHGRRGITLASYSVPEVPLVVSGGGDPHEFAVVMRHGVVVEQFDATDVHWLDGGRFSVMTAISSTIGKVKLGPKHVEPVRSKAAPPDVNKPVLILDVGHAQYGSRYLFQTLRCVARDVEIKVGQSAGLVLSSWTWSTKGIGGLWCQPAERVEKRRRLSGSEENDVLDVIDVDLAT